MKPCEDDPLDLVIDGGERYQREQEEGGYLPRDQDSSMPYNLEFNISLNGPMPGLLQDAATREQGTDVTRTARQLKENGARQGESNTRTREKRHTIIGYYADNDPPPGRNHSEKKNNITFNQHINSLRRIDNETANESPERDGPA